MTEVDIQDYCRICLDVKTEHVSILGDPTIHLHLKTCLALTISPLDHLPKRICASCVSQLSEFYNFQLDARCSQDWLETTLEEKAKKSTGTKTPIQPLPDSEYNSDSLLEFLNNTANIEEYLNNLGRDDIPSIVNLLDKNESDAPSTIKKKEFVKQNKTVDMEIDVLDSEADVVKKMLFKEMLPKSVQSISHWKSIDQGQLKCFACDHLCDDLHKLSAHLSVCDAASRCCIRCKLLCNSRQKLQQHFITHTSSPPFACNCGKQYQTKELLFHHHKKCVVDYGALLGCTYKCKECGETFAERLLLYRHAKKHVYKAEKRICDICGHIYIGSEALDKHKQDEHNISNKSVYRCKICGTTSVSHHEMYLHVLKHTARKHPARQLCELCGQSFSSQSALTKHLVHHRSHTIQCKICMKRFKDKQTLDQHKLEHNHLIMCERCGQSITSYKIDMHTC